MGADHVGDPAVRDGLAAISPASVTRRRSRFTSRRIDIDSDDESFTLLTTTRVDCAFAVLFAL
jgi:hypothetical protein